MKTIAIVLAAGSGKRMGTSTKKQYLLLKDKPILYYSLKTFEESFIDEIILVTSADDIDFVKREIVDRYSFGKVIKTVVGGAQRYNSVLNGLNAIDSSEETYVFIHDGARPMIDQEILSRAYEAVKEHKACVVGMPSKDTVKIASEEGFISSSPNRNLVWNVQTPQVFELELIREAYNYVVNHEEEYVSKGINITDDTMVLDMYNSHPVKLVEGSYSNIKVTTPEDMSVLEKLIGK